MLILKQSTSIDIRMGPFVDVTDGATPEVGITIGAADQAEVLKANGAATVAMAGTFAAVTGADGWYDYTVATGDVDTVGEVVFVVQDVSICLPVYTRAYVVEEAVYDAMYGAASTGPLQGTTAGNKLDVNATGEAGLDLDNTSGTLAAAQIATGAITAAKFAAGAIDAAAIATDAIDADALAADAVDEFWNEAMVETTGAPAVTGTFRAAFQWMFALSRNKITQTATLTTLRNDADGADLATAVISDDATTYTRAKWST